MAKQQTKKDDSHGKGFMLPVIDERPWAYIVEYEGKNFQVRKFDFQRRPGLSRPLRLQCIAERKDNGSLFFKQDLAPIFAERYKKGQIYDFTIDADMTNTDRPHYKVSDGSGYWIQLPAKDGDVQLHKGDRVKLRVTGLKGIHLYLSLVRDYLPQVAEMPKLTDFLARFGRPFTSLLVRLVANGALPQAKALYDEGDKAWLLTGLREAREYIFNLNGKPDATLAESVSTYRDVVTYLLEDSGFLRNAGDQPRNVLQEEFARDVARADDLLAAMKHIADNDQDQFVRETFDKIRRSGYLYRPESKLRQLMYIFSLQSGLIDKCMDQLIEIIQQGDTDNWMAEPFRSAFVEQLQLYIDASHARFDQMSDAEADSGTARRLDRLIRAIAIQQLLEDTGNTPSQETVINRSRLYRYYAFMKNAERDRMLEKSLHVLLTEEIDTEEYSWSDTKSVQLLMNRLLHAPEPIDGVQKYESSGVVMNIKDGKIEFRACAENANRSVLPNLGLWHGMQVYLPSLLSPEYRSPRSISDYRGVWNEIEYRLFQERRAHRAPEPIVVKQRTLMPEVGDTVDIIIDRATDEDQGVYHCTVVETGYYGQGTIDIREISGSRRPLHIKAFRDEEGNPLVFRAKVISSNDKELQFSLVEGIRSYIRESVDIDDEVACVINNTPGRYNDFTYTGLTEHGYIVSIKADDSTVGLTLGSQVNVRITGAERDGSLIRASYVGPSDTFVEYEPALETLLFSYGRELPPAEKVEPEEIVDEQTESDNDVLLTDANAREVMHIIARRADMETDLVKSYNYFAAARLLARIISSSKDDAMRQYYDQRCRVLEILDDFATNGRIDLERLEKFNTQIMRNSAANPYAIKLRILAAMERPEHTDAVWQIIKDTNSDDISQLGRLVIAYNAIDGFKLGEEQRKIREHIYTLLKLDIERQPEQIAGGTESQYVEFKTSAVYPAGGVMRVDVARQMTELVEVICGFLNSTGGHLYIGVSDEGYVRGLANDLEYFGSLDKLMLELHNSIRSQMGFISAYATYINIQPETFGEKTIIHVKIAPLPKPVQANGVYYERQGSSTEYVPKSKEDEFLRRHNLLGARSQTAPAIPVVTPQPAAAPVSVAEEPVALSPAPVAEKPAAAPTSPATAKSGKTKEGGIATSRLRRNHIHYDGANDYVAPALFFFVNEDGSYQASPDEIWTDDEAALALGLTEDETANSVLIVYRSGHVAKVTVDELMRSRRAKLCAKEKIVFIAPVSDTDGLLAYFKDDRNVYYKQYFAPETLPETKPTNLGEKLIPGTPVHCETVCAECHNGFTGIQRNGQRVGRTKDELNSDIAESYNRLG